MKYRVGDEILIKVTISDIDAADKLSIYHVELDGESMGWVNASHIVALVKRGKKVKPAPVEDRAAPDTQWCNCAVEAKPTVRINALAATCVHPWRPVSAPPHDNRDVWVLLDNTIEIRGWHGDTANRVYAGWHIYDQSNPGWKPNEADDRVIAWRELEGKK